MGTKRKFTAVHPSRQNQVPQESRKRFKPEGLGNKSFKKAHPVNDIKTRIRSLSRLLARKDDALPPQIRIDKEREFASTQRELEEAMAAKRKSKMIARYHKVRFFDRQKAAKRLKRARKELRGLSEDVDEQIRSEAGTAVDEAEVDVNYAMYYPLDMPYSSLFPNRKDGHDDGHDEQKEEEAVDKLQERQGDPKLRQLVKECMANGRLEDLRNGKLTADSVSLEERLGSLPKSKAPNDSGGSRGKAKKMQTHPSESDEESEGGFFE